MTAVLVPTGACAPAASGVGGAGRVPVLLRCGAAALGARRAAVVIPAALATLLLVASAPVLDETRWVVRVAQACAVLLALTVAAAADDPAGDTADATPLPLWARTLARTLLVVGVWAALWAAVVAVGAARADGVAWGRLTVQAAGVAMGGLALALYLVRRRVDHPVETAGAVLALAVLLSYQLPRTWAIWDVQPWGPPWQASGIRWASLLVLSGAVIALQLRDPATPARRTVGRRSRSAASGQS